MKMVSYWHNEKHDGEPVVFHTDEEMSLVYGYYSHKDPNGKGCRSIGVYWRRDFPQSFGRLAPCVIPDATANLLIDGLILAARNNGDDITKLMEARKFMDEGTNS